MLQHCFDFEFFAIIACIFEPFPQLMCCYYYGKQQFMIFLFINVKITISSVVLCDI